MAVEADSVVVELIAQNAQFDAATKATAQSFQQSMGDIQKAGAGAEKGVGQFSSALKSNRLEMNQSRIGMMEFQHIARGVSDQFATSGLSTQLFTSHIGELSEAVVLTGGAFGKLGLFLQGPWGIAMTLALSAAVPLLVNLLGQKNALDDLYNKLVKHKEQTALSAQAEDIWSHTLDGLIDRTKKLSDELGKRLTTQSALNDALMQTAREEYAAALSAEARLDAGGASPDQVAKASKEVTAAAMALHEAQLSATDAAAKGSTDLSQAAKDWVDAQARFMQQIVGEHPELTGNESIQQAVDLFNKAAEEAASAHMPFASFTDQVHSLDTQLLNGSVSADTFAARMRALAGSLNETTSAFKNQDQAVSKFKQAVIGAEGTGPNKLGSSAAGFGQFMPSTWLSLFDKAYPSQAGLSDTDKLALRNNRTVAEGVIEEATKGYVDVLKAAGQQITEAALYTVHLLGAGGARKLFSAAPGTPTSSLFSAGVLNGNPFLRGTAADARAAIAGRIGDSSSAVSAGAVAIQKEITDEAEKQAKLWEKIGDELTSNMVKGAELTDEFKKQTDLVPKIGAEALVDKSAMVELEEQAKNFTDQLNEATQMGDQFVQDVLNPDNWKSFGSIAHTVLMDIMKDLETIALLNPIENWLDGGHRLTFGSLFSLFGGGGGAGVPSLQSSDPSGALYIPPFAGGGAFKVNGGTDTNVLSINGQARGRVSADETIAIIPSNASAASPMAAAQSLIRLVVEASPYFDGRVAEVAGPIAVQAGTSGAYTGAGMARANLARRQTHQLGSRG